MVNCKTYNPNKDDVLFAVKLCNDMKCCFQHEDNRIEALYKKFLSDSDLVVTKKQNVDGRYYDIRIGYDEAIMEVKVEVGQGNCDSLNDTTLEIYI